MSWLTTPSKPGPKTAALKRRLGFLADGFYLTRSGFAVKRLAFWRIALRCVVTALVTWLIIVGCLRLAKNKIIFHPVKGLTISMSALGYPFEDVWLTGSSGGKLHGWYLPAPPGHRTILLFGGAAGNLAFLIDRIKLLRETGFGVMAIDYEGYGLSEGAPSEAATYHDAEAAWDFLVSRGIEPEAIVIYGYSLGGAVAARLAKSKMDHQNPLVLDCAFTTFSRLVAWKIPKFKSLGRQVFGQTYDATVSMKGLKPKVLLVFHAHEDEEVPVWMGHGLYDNHRVGDRWYTELYGGHDDFPLNASIYRITLETRLGVAISPPEPLASEEEDAPSPRASFAF